MEETIQPGPAPSCRTRIAILIGAAIIFTLPLLLLYAAQKITDGLTGPSHDFPIGEQVDLDDRMVMDLCRRTLVLDGKNPDRLTPCPVTGNSLDPNQRVVQWVDEANKASFFVHLQREEKRVVCNVTRGK